MSCRIKVRTLAVLFKTQKTPYSLTNLYLLIWFSTKNTFSLINEHLHWITHFSKQKLQSTEMLPTKVALIPPLLKHNPKCHPWSWTCWNKTVTVHNTTWHEGLTLPGQSWVGVTPPTGVLDLRGLGRLTPGEIRGRELIRRTVERRSRGRNGGRRSRGRRRTGTSNIE